MQGDIINSYKKEGDTPLESINILKNNNEKYKNSKMTYAGRLDPLAEGILIILTDEMCQKKDEFLKLDKEYEVDILLGFKTDTYDILGIIEEMDNIEYIKDEIITNYINRITSLKGKIEQEYPPYSSKTVKGKPLFEWARENKLAQIKLPKNKVKLDSIELIKIDYIKETDLLNSIIERIAKIKGDFRQSIIISTWKKHLIKNRKFPIIKIRINCGSGFYVRSIVNKIGEEENISALAYRIKRTRVGNYK